MNKIWEKDGFMIRLAQREDAEKYIQNFNPLDQETARMTGSKQTYTRDELSDYFYKAINDEDRYFFLIFDSMGEVLGEAVINEIDWELRQGNFRIAIFQPIYQGKGIGSRVIETIRDFAFEELKLHRLSLEVFSFNQRAKRAYLKAGFKVEGLLKDAFMDEGRYADVILMALLEDEWKALNNI